MKFIGRTAERKTITEQFQNDCFQSVLIYGRLRVGKSELIKQCIKDSGVSSLYYECKDASEMNNVISLSRLVAEKYQLPSLGFQNMEEVLRYLFERSVHEKLVLVLDEYPYLRKKADGMDSILQTLIDEYHHHCKMKLVICGSYVDVMKELLQNESPLYGRFSKVFNLLQMDCLDASGFYPSYSNEEKIQMYSVLGGIPYYCRMVDPDRSVKENIVALIASAGSPLEAEIGMYLKSEISKMANANEVFECMASGVSKYSELLSKSHVSSSPALADILTKLINMDLVVKEAPINDPDNNRKAGYFISDNLALFYYRYVFRYLSQINVMDPDQFFERYIRNDFESQYVLMIFERVSRQFLIRMNWAGRVEPPFIRIGKYYYDDPENHTNGEFDLVTEDDEGYVFYECKFKDRKTDRKMIETEISQVEKTGMDFHACGFISKSGYAEDTNDMKIIRYTLDDLFDHWQS